MIPEFLQESIFAEDLYKPKARPAIILSKPWLEVSVEERNQLIKIIDALSQRIDPSLTFDAFQIKYFSNIKADSLKKFSDRCIYFGPRIDSVLFYEVTQVENKRMVLSDSLETLVNDEELKSKLWAALKQLFTI